jgi:hypothetical protein
MTGRGPSPLPEPNRKPPTMATWRSLKVTQRVIGARYVEQLRRLSGFAQTRRILGDDQRVMLECQEGSECDRVSFELLKRK